MAGLLFLHPVFKEMIWGGNRLKEVYGFDCTDGTGECWLISAHPHGMGTVSQGSYEGKTLKEMWEEYPELFGNEDGRYGDKYPLLVKLIDAAQDLSIQVHPDDGYAGKHTKGSLGKMECWYVLDCKENASIIIGHRAESKKQMQEMIDQKQWKDFLREVPVKRGDFFQIDPGCVHAIKEGTLILETQQSSDITYRVYDYDRLQDGKPRQLHIEESKEVIQAPFVPAEHRRMILESDSVDMEHLVACSKYSVEKYTIHGKWLHNFRAPFTNVTVTDGEGTVDGTEVHKGTSFIVTKDSGAMELSGDFTILCSWAEYQAGQEYAGYRITVEDWMGRKKAQIEGEEQGILAFQDIYEEGDRIRFEVPEAGRFYQIRVDDTMDESLVYLTKKEIIYDIPFAEKKKSYNRKSFSGERHYLTIRAAEDYEVLIYKNLAKNVMDQHGDRGCYPHASANVETRGESVFAARNAIDGVLANSSHGSWPYESWGINKNDQAEMTLEFGRKVDFDKIVLYTRADFPHDNWWTSATFTFSDGTQETVHMQKSDRPHMFAIQKNGITWMRLGNLIKADDPSPFPALTQLEVYGTEHRTEGEQR